MRQESHSGTGVLSVDGKEVARASPSSPTTAPNANLPTTSAGFRWTGLDKREADAERLDFTVGDWQLKQMQITLAPEVELVLCDDLPSNASLERRVTRAV
jgi:hypothetical protein